ncbi:amino acid deaminase/aldolase [Knoellia sp. S7-12]|uniref:amino acid deaminase/aldolase n=1 Tax=Knoellia sp. S7-12 TaxID=3126698 RepID=UPI003367CF7F
MTITQTSHVTSPGSRTRVTGLPSTFTDLDEATSELDPPFGVVDFAALRLNADAMARRAAGKPIRLASKSVRCRSIITEVLAMPAYHGVLSLTLAEALWLADEVDDVVVGYPSADRASLRRLATDELLAARVTLMVDSVEALDFIESVIGASGPRLRVCLELDASLRLAGGRIHLGPRRSPVHTPTQARVLAEQILARPRFQLVGMMAYEGQIAGMGDNQPGSALRRLAVRGIQHLSTNELAERRAEAVSAVRHIAALEFVNGGGTGSIEQTVAEDAVTEVAAGSGLYGPTLFDHYRAFSPHPAAYFATSVVRRPAPGIVTVLGGGWIASGPVGRDRVPTPVWPSGLQLIPAEGAGEAQTPLRGAAADRLHVGDKVWFRHAKAGELCERVDALQLVEGNEIVDTVPTYRGEGHAFL